MYMKKHIKSRYNDGHVKLSHLMDKKMYFVSLYIHTHYLHTHCSHMILSKFP